MPLGERVFAVQRHKSKLFYSVWNRDYSGGTLNNQPQAETSSDVNLDGGVDGSDVDAFFGQWSAGGC